MGPASLLALAIGLSDSSNPVNSVVVASNIRPASIGVTLSCVASVSAQELNIAKDAVARIFRKSGVQVVWHGCFNDLAPTANEPAASVGHMGSPLEVTVLVLPHSMTERLDTSMDTMGAAPGTHPGRRRLAYAFYDRVELFAQVYRFASSGQVLGTVIAHEIGHLMLPYHSHSAHGIMRASWALDDFQALSKGWLLFTPEQTELLRARLGQ